MIESFLYHHHTRAINGDLHDSVIQNCHVKGLTSIMLHDKPGNRIRMFFAEANHELWKNNHSGIGLKMSLGYHAHHCHLRLHGIFGNAQSIQVGLQETDSATGLLEYKYTSKILANESSMVPTGRQYRTTCSTNVGLTGKSLALHAKTKHTVYVPMGEQAAWLVFEGKEDPDYISYCYTNNDEFDPSGLYTKPDYEWASILLMCCMSRLKDDK